jgi:hypothetical protein
VLFISAKQFNSFLLNNSTFLLLNRQLLIPFTKKNTKTKNHRHWTYLSVWQPVSQSEATISTNPFRDLKTSQNIPKLLISQDIVSKVSLEKCFGNCSIRQILPNHHEIHTPNLLCWKYLNPSSSVWSPTLLRLLFGYSLHLSVPCLLVWFGLWWSEATVGHGWKNSYWEYARIDVSVLQIAFLMHCCTYWGCFQCKYKCIASLIYCQGLIVAEEHVVLFYFWLFYWEYCIVIFSLSMLVWLWIHCSFVQLIGKVLYKRIFHCKKVKFYQI